MPLRAQWREVKKLIASDGDLHDRFGESVSFSGNQAIVSAYRLDLSDDIGAAYIFEKDASGTWTFIAENTQILFDESTTNETKALILNLTATETILQFEEPNDKFGLLISEFTLVPSFN